MVLKDTYITAVELAFNVICPYSRHDFHGLPSLLRYEVYGNVRCDQLALDV